MEESCAESIGTSLQSNGPSISPIGKFSKYSFTNIHQIIIFILCILHIFNTEATCTSNFTFGQFGV